MQRTLRIFSYLVVVTPMVAFIAGCGGSSDSSSDASATGDASATADTNVDGTSAIVDTAAAGKDAKVTTQDAATMTMMGAPIPV